MQVVSNPYQKYSLGQNLTSKNSTKKVRINYVYGYQGSEADNEIKGNGNSYTTEFRQLDPRLGRWLSLDPMMDKLPWQSPYCSMDNNPIWHNDKKGDITDKEERKLRKEQKQLERDNTKLSKKEKKWAESFAKKNNGTVQQSTDANGVNRYSVNTSPDDGVGVKNNSSPYSSTFKSNNNRLSQIKNSVEGYYYNEGDFMGIAVSVGYDMYFCGGISGSADMVMVGGETCIGGTFGGGLGIGGGVGVDVQFIYCTAPGRYRAKDIQEGDGWEFAATIGPLSYSRSGDRTDTQFHWNGATNTAGSFDASGVMSKENWQAIYKVMALRSLGALKGKVAIKYEWNQSNVWGNW